MPSPWFGSATFAHPSALSEETRMMPASGKDVPPRPAPKVRFPFLARRWPWLTALALAALLLLGLGLFLRSSQKTGKTPPHHDRVARQHAPDPSGHRQGQGLPAAKPSDTDLSFDAALPFAANLDRFKRLCGLGGGDAATNQRILDFAECLLGGLEGNEALIVAELQDHAGPAAYVNFLMGFLLRLNVPGKDALIWEIALDGEADADVRQTAAFFLSSTEATVRHPEGFAKLLSDSDDQGKVFALQLAGAHMDEAGYELVKETYADCPDIHVRVAALNAIGGSSFAGSQELLLEVIAATPTSAATSFSQDSLLKRAALAHLDLSRPGNDALIRGIAADPGEDPGIRRRAMLTYAATGSGEANAFLLGLLRGTPQTEPVLIKGAVEALLAIGRRDGREAIQAKRAEIADPHVKTMIDNLLAQQ